MSKLIITVSGSPAVNGYRIREFKWIEAYRAFLYEGREFADTEFNDAFAKAWRQNPDLMPKAKVVQTSQAVHALSQSPVVPEPVTQIATISSSREITLEEAEATMVRLAPDRLKKKTGPRPQVMEVA